MQICPLPIDGFLCQIGFIGRPHYFHFNSFFTIPCKSLIAIMILIARQLSQSTLYVIPVGQHLQGIVSKYLYKKDFLADVCVKAKCFSLLSFLDMKNRDDFSCGPLIGSSSCLLYGILFIKLTLTIQLEAAFPCIPPSFKETLTFRLTSSSSASTIHPIRFMC